MRQLTPTNKIEVLKPITISDEQYKELLHLIDELNTSSESNKVDLEKLKSDLQIGLSTGTLDADTITAVNAILESIAVESLGANKIIADEAAIANLKSAFARIDVINSDNIVTDKVKATSNIEAPQATFGDVVTTSITADDANFTNFTVENFNADKINSESIIATEGISTPHIDATEGVFDDLTSDTFATNKLDSPEAVIDDLYSEVIHNRFMLHNAKFNRMDLDTFSLAADGQWWCVLPKFVNGKYDLVAREESTDENGNIVLGPYLWAMEILNDTKNLSFTWSVKGDDQYLLEVDIVEDASDDLQYIQIHGQLGGKHTAVYYRCDSHETTLPPVFYGTKQVDGTKNFVFNRQAGRWIPNSTFAGEFHAESMLIDDVEFETVTITHNIRLPIAYDQYGAPTGYHRGSANQYIRNIEDEFGNEGLEWTTPADKVVDGDDRLITSDAIYNYDGTAYTKDDDNQTVEAYPITELGDNTEVHGSIEVDDNIQNRHFYVGTEDKYQELEDNSELDDALTIREDVDDPTKVTIARRQDFNGDIKTDEIIPSNSDKDLVDQKPLIYNQDRNAIETTDSISIDDLNVDTLRANEAFINGTLHYVDEETIESTSDLITLRANNTTPLAEGQVSGIVVNNYDGKKDLALVTDNTGTLRVGTGGGETSTYTDIAYKNGLWYDIVVDEEMSEVTYEEMQAQPIGTMTSWENKREENDYTCYDEVTFTVIDKTSLQPILTRSEDVDLNDQGLLKWNKESYKADTIDLPNKSEQHIISDIIPAVPEETTYAVGMNGHVYDADLSEVDISEWRFNDNVALFDKSGHLRYDETNDKYYYYDGADYYNVTGFDFENLEVLVDDNPTEDDTSAIDPTNLLCFRNEFVTREAEPQRVEYKWIDKPAGIYRFATEEEYEEYAANNNIPTNSLIYIDEPTTYVWGEWQGE